MGMVHFRPGEKIVYKDEHEMKEPVWKVMGGAASKLLPETVKPENQEDKGAPLLNDND